MLVMLIDSKYWVSAHQFDARHSTGILPQQAINKKSPFNYFNLSVSDSPHHTSDFLASEILVKINKLLSEKISIEL